MKTKTELKNRSWMQFKNFIAVLSGVVLLCLAAAKGSAQTYSVLHAFTGADGAYPYGGLVLFGTAFYGTTQVGGNSNRGTVFRINSDGSGYTVLKHFTGTDGAWPQAGLVLSGTTLYGTTRFGGPGYTGSGSGAGTVFKINLDGSGFAVLRQFANYDGAHPDASLVLSGTTLYGVTAEGGSTYSPPISGYGVVFKVNIDGSGFTVLKNCGVGDDGSTPHAGLLLSGTTLYGTTYYGGAGAAGTVFKISTDGSGYSVLTSFRGGCPHGTLLLSGDTLYGTTEGYESSGGGVFKLMANDTGYALLKGFAGSDGSKPEAGLVLYGTTLYGTTSKGYTSGDNTIFQINTDGSGFTVLQYLAGSPQASLVLFGSALYGTTANGGNGDRGVVFALSLSPTILTDPVSQTIGTGSNADLTVVASGAPVLNYQWYFNHTNALSDGINSTLHLGNVQSSQAGSYNVVVTNAFDAVTSAPAMINVVGLPPTIQTPPESKNGANDYNVYFSVLTAGSLPMSYQWYFNITNVLAIGTNSDLVLTNVQFSQSGTYHVVVTNAYGSVTSSPALLTVIPPATLSDCTEAALRVAMVTEAHTVKFACDGTITLGSTIAFWVDTILDGSGHQVTISGGNLVQVFQVNNNVSLTLINLTIANGLSTNGYGGGIYNGGTVNAMNCHFIANQAQGAWGGYYGLPGKDGCGGAVYNSGTLNIIDCSFAWNSARGGKGGEGIMTSYLPAGIGGVGGAGNGGAIYNLGLLAIKGSTFTSNSTIGGTGGFGGGGAMSLYPIDGGAGGMGGDGNGSILFNNGSASLVNSTFALNSSIGGAGGPGGGGNQPAVPDYGYGKTGPNGLGGSGFGAICDTNGHIYLTNCTLAFNSGTGSTAFGGLKISGGQLVNTLLATTPPGSNCLGKITDAGHNLSSDGSCAFTNIGSRNNVDPKLSPLANNGGPTLTMALLPGSPAIDAGDNASAPPTDQRGVVRPSGVASDIGAYECSPPSLTIPPPTQTAEIGTTIEFTAQASTFTPATYQWFFNGNAINGCTNSVLCLSGIQASNVGAYTLVVSNIAGVVTSSPAMLNVIAPVERRPVPGIKLTGEAGSLLNVDYANSLSPSPNWTTLGSVSLTSTSQFCPDLTMPLPPERFYRAWQTGTPGVVPSLNLNFVPAIMLTGKVGDSLHLDCINAIGPTNDWVTLATVTLTNTSQLYFDVSAPGQPARLYRIVPVP